MGKFNSDTASKAGKISKRGPSKVTIRTRSFIFEILKEKGLIKMSNFKSSQKKSGYSYILTLKGLKEKSRLTINFMKKKIQEYEELKKDLEN